MRKCYAIISNALSQHGCVGILGSGRRHVADLRGLYDDDKSDRDGSDQDDRGNEYREESDPLDSPRDDIFLIWTR